ncbi:low affinity immunoglobulin epsilon Fc receptor-like [Poecilia reticulata]|uniref:Low affinity immunoglobulin epsilon Fc receptor-like n=1 Tax=Poecilia reticulata TaxID=8081 RepID=A0A3P9NWU9_POERE|nr:PREDICTED: low affinity immunoglobulin epsilon Fc receptor-like [Poecilia reticulata]
MSYEDRVVHLLTYLRTDFRSPRSITPSRPEYGPENKSTAIVEFKRIFKLIWHIVLIGILSGILLAVVLVIIIEWNTNQDVIMSLEQLKEEMAINTERLLEEKNLIAEQLNLTRANFSILKAEYDQMWDKSSCNLTVLEMEINRLNGVLKIAGQSRDQYEKQVKQLTNQVKSFQNNIRLLEQDKRKQSSILSSKRLDYIWSLCNRTTLRCSRCIRGWKEHNSRCFLLTKVDKNWENARIDCLKYKGDLAVVLNAEDQAFLTNLTFQFKKANPSINFHSAWIGLQDLVKEGVHFWVNGERIKWDAIYWRPGEPNNDITTRDTDQAGQDCVSIVPPNAVGPEGWMNSWDDITCDGKRHYICETEALILA